MSKKAKMYKHICDEKKLQPTKENKALYIINRVRVFYEFKSQKS